MFELLQYALQFMESNKQLVFCVFNWTCIEFHPLIRVRHIVHTLLMLWSFLGLLDFFALAYLPVCLAYHIVIPVWSLSPVCAVSLTLTVCSVGNYSSNLLLVILRVSDCVCTLYILPLILLFLAIAQIILCGPVQRVAIDLHGCQLIVGKNWSSELVSFQEVWHA